MLKSIVLNVCLFLFINANVNATNYCSKSLCSGSYHIACGHSRLFSNTCPVDRHLVKLTAENKAFILRAHNKFRSRISQGGVPGFCPASRMATMKWNDELAYLASLNVLQCEMKHDHCRNTDIFKYVGQNLAWRGQTWEYEDVESVMSNSMHVWFNEYALTNQGVINRCCGSNIYDIGHFLQMVYDRAGEIGCAFARYSNFYKTGLFACNYSAGNIKGYKVYKCGKPASGCLYGSNPLYPGLCHPSEPIDSNQVY